MPSPLYPPSPWHLRGTVRLSVWWVPKNESVPALPSGVRPFLLFGRALVAAVWVVYEPGGVLQYNEVAAMTLVRHPRGIGGTISRIWVDSMESMVGGRELWAIPKELARFRVVKEERFEADAEEVDGTAIASCHFFSGLRLPGRWPFRIQIAQEGEEGLVVTPLRARGRVHLGRATWDIPFGSRLAWIGSRRPWLSVGIDEAEIVFGA